jgi:hypothetical protein
MTRDALPARPWEPPIRLTMASGSADAVAGRERDADALLKSSSGTLERSVGASPYSTRPWQLSRDVKDGASSCRREAECAIIEVT